MSSILNCPACHGELALPEGRLKRIECPHCQKELLLAAEVADETDHSPRQLLIAPAAREPVAKPVEAAPSAAAAEFRQRMAKQARRPSMLGQMIGIMAGGMLGTVMGYWLLNYFGGPRYDFLGVRLPLVPHTQGALPPPVEAPATTIAGPRLQQEAPLHNGADQRIVVSSAVSSPEASILPTSPPSPAKQVINDPEYLPEELGRALTAAYAAAGCEHCQSTGFVKKIIVTGASEINGKRIERRAEERQPCEICGGKPTGRINAEVYEKFCRLSQVITYLKAEPGDAQIHHRKEAVEQVFLRAAADREKQAALGRLAAHHLKNHGRKENGILLAGTVQETGKTGDYYWVRLLLFGLPEEVVVVSRMPARTKPHDRLLLAGSILDEPLERLPNYRAAASQVIWGGLPIPLPADK